MQTSYRKIVKGNLRSLCKKFETWYLLYYRNTIQPTEMYLISTNSLGIKLFERVQFVSVPFMVLEISQKMF